MTGVPDFTKIGLDDGSAPATARGRASASVAWEAPEGIAIQSAYTAADTAGLDNNVAHACRTTSFALKSGRRPRIDPSLPVNCVGQLKDSVQT